MTNIKNPRELKFATDISYSITADCTVMFIRSDQRKIMNIGLLSGFDEIPQYSCTSPGSFLDSPYSLYYGGVTGDREGICKCVTDAGNIEIPYIIRYSRTHVESRYRVIRASKP